MFGQILFDKSLKSIWLDCFQGCLDINPRIFYKLRIHLEPLYSIFWFSVLNFILSQRLMSDGIKQSDRIYKVRSFFLESHAIFQTQTQTQIWTQNKGNPTALRITALNANSATINALKTLLYSAKPCGLSLTHRIKASAIAGAFRVSFGIRRFARILLIPLRGNDRTGVCDRWSASGTWRCTRTQLAIANYFS